MQYSKSPVGAILEFFYLLGKQEYQKQKEWIEINYLKGQTWSWLNKYAEPAQLNQMLNRKNLHAEKSKIYNIISALENNYLIEPNRENDNDSTMQRSITPLGEALFLENRYLEYIQGFNYIYQNWKKSIAKIYDGVDNEGIATGFLIENNFVVTAGHVLDDLKNITIKFEDGYLEYKPQDFIRPQDKRYDIGIIKLNIDVVEKIQPFVMQTDFDVLDEVLFMGYPPVPYTDNAYIIANKGEISSLVTGIDRIQYMIISTLSRGGFSGGPVLNRRGNVIGIKVGSFDKALPVKNDTVSGINEGIGFNAAISSIWIQDIIDSKI